LIRIVFFVSWLVQCLPANLTAMKKISLLVLILLIIQIKGYSQPCLPNGFTFQFQEDIDDFQADHPNCTEIDGNVTIKGYRILNLEGLSALTYIGGELYLFDMDSLNSLSGLDNLDSIGGNLIIQYNPGLTSLTGLLGVTSVGGYLEIENNDRVSDLSGLANLNFIGGKLSIAGNDSLATMAGLENVTSLGGGLYITSNRSLTSLEGLGNISSIAGDLDIFSNHSLNSLSGLESLDVSSIVDLYIIYNHSLLACNEPIICEYLANPYGSVNIYDNAPGCDNPAEVSSSCGIDLQCLPYGNYYFYSQAGVDEFQLTYPDCADLEGDVNIYFNNITNLNGLNAVTSIGGNLNISGSAITSLAGLENLHFVGGDIDLSDNDSLSSLMGLESIDSIGGSLIFHSNDMLTQIDQLESLNYLGGSLTIIANDALSSVEGLHNLNYIGRGIDVEANYALTSLEGLNNIDSIRGNFKLYSCVLTEISGLQNISFIGGSLTLIHVEYLTNLDALENLTSIGENVSIASNDSLSSLSGLKNLNSIGGYLKIYENPNLISLDGLDFIDDDSITDLSIYSNSNLSTCDVQSVCNYLADHTGYIDIADNAPGCNNRAEVEAACGVGVSEVVSRQSSVVSYPNPVADQASFCIHLQDPAKVKLTVFNNTGQIVATILDEPMEKGEHLVTWNCKHVAPGIYFYRILVNDEASTRKLIKMR
jgi:hypothetical protein